MLIIKILEFLAEFLPGPIEGLQNFYALHIQPALEQVNNIIAFVSWVLPMDAILNVLRVTLGLIVVRVAVAIWKLIPLT